MPNGYEEDHDLNAHELGVIFVDTRQYLVFGGISTLTIPKWWCALHQPARFVSETKLFDEIQSQCSHLIK